MRLLAVVALASLAGCASASLPPAERAAAAAQAGQWDAALGELERAIAAQPTSLELRRERVRAAHEAGRLDELAARLRAEARGTSPAVLFELALAVARAGEPGSDLEAIALLERVVEALPGEAEPRYRIGLLRLEQELPCEAVPPLEAAGAMAGRSGRYRVALGAALAGCGRDDEARAALAGLLGLEVSVGDIARARAILAGMNNPVRRVPHALRSTYRDALSALAEDSAPGEAVQLVEEALRAAPDSAPFLTLLGLANVRLGQLGRATVAFERAVELWPGDATPWIELAALAEDSSDLAGAEARLERALSVDPLSADVLAELGRLRYRRRRYHEAAEAFRHLAVVDRGTTVSRLWLGRALRRAGRDGEAESVYLELLESRPRTFEACVQLGNIYRRRRLEARDSARAEELSVLARRYYRMALEVRPQDPMVQRMLSALEGEGD